MHMACVMLAISSGIVWMHFSAGLAVAMGESHSTHNKCVGTRVLWLC